MLIIPRATEKAYTEQTKHTYIFEVPLSASKQLVSTEVAKQYGVTVTDVRTNIRKGKPTRFSRGKHAYPGTTNRRDRKYAYVTLKEGDSIKVFEEATETPKEEAKPAKSTEEKKPGLLSRNRKKSDKSEGEK